MITSIQNGKIKDVVKLRDKSRERRSSGLFITEGVRMFCEAPDDRIREIYLSESMYDRLFPEHAAADEKMAADENGYADACRLKLSKHAYETVTDEVMKHMSDTQTPQGILCVIAQTAFGIDDILSAGVFAGRTSSGRQPHLVLMLEGLQDPGNLGTIFRTAEAAGVTGIIMSRDTVDIYNPKTIRSTMGSIYRVPFTYTDDICAAAKMMRKHGISIYAAYLGGSVPYERCSYTGDTAFMIGNEGNGLTEQAASCADSRVMIPMEGSVESLNAAVSAAVLLYEAHRQRNA